jgi:carbonic anhydrase/acetyltransferase-like protein (isoleucine patch superfamily)
MYGAVLDSEASAVSIGASSIICENAVIRATAEGDSPHPVVIGDHVFIGPHATLLGCTLDGYVYVATGATVLQGAKVGSGSIIAVGALVHANAVVPEGDFIPPHNIAIGDPLQVYPPSDKDLVARIRAIGFPTAAFGTRPDPTDRFSVCRGATEIRSKEFEAHLSDIMME